jgi:hypothetical protein
MADRTCHPVGLIHFILYCNIHCKHDVYHCHYTSSGYYGKELPRVNKLYERNLCSRSRTNVQYFVSVCRVYFMSSDTILMCSILYKGVY